MIAVNWVTSKERWYHRSGLEKRNCSVSCIIFPEIINPCLLFPGYQVDILYLLSVSVYFGSIVTGRPVNDAKGRWRPGGGMNVSVRIEIREL